MQPQGKIKYIEGFPQKAQTGILLQWGKNRRRLFERIFWLE